MMPCRAELEGKDLFLGIGEVKGAVGKLVAVAHEDGDSCMTHIQATLSSEEVI